ncbi:MAG: Riboflavin transporter RibZ [Syntrophus sp. SKADARSKE-3]|nr:Riboflavin transporter RibZ [Syntrophus sp. SKADARSKE-3]
MISMIFINKTMKEADETTKKIVLIATTAASFLTPFMGSAVNIGLPAVGHEFSLSAVMVGWVSYSFLLAAATVMIPIGRIADIWGRKKIFVYGLVAFTVSSFFCSIALSPAFLILSRTLQGLGAAMIFGTSIAILTSVFPAGERGRILGINVASVYLGLSMGPFLGGFLTEHFGWRSIFLVTVPSGLLILFLVLRKMKWESHGRKDEQFDYLGACLYMASLFSVMYGISSIKQSSGLYLTSAGIILFIVFIARERRTASPLFGEMPFRGNTIFIFSNLAALINYSATYAVSFLLSLYLQFIHGYNPFHAGIILLVQPVVQALFSPASGRLSDRIEPRLLASIGMMLTAGGLALLVLLDGHGTVFFIVMAQFALGLGFALFSSPNTNAIMSSVENTYYGVASGMLATMRLMGQTMSMAIVMLIISLHIGDARITLEQYPAFTGSLHSSLIVFCILCIAGIFASLARGKVH